MSLKSNRIRDKALPNLTSLINNCARFKELNLLENVFSSCAISKNLQEVFLSKKDPYLVSGPPSISHLEVLRIGTVTDPLLEQVDHLLNIIRLDKIEL